MNYKKILLLSLFILNFSLVSPAQEEEKEEIPSLWDGIVIEKFVTKNPFRPQLPEKEVIQKVIPKEIKPDRIEENKKSIWDRFKTTQPDRKEPKQEVKKEIPIIPPELRITGLIWNTDRPQAIINGQIVDIGDTVSATKVVAIRKNGIDISFKGKTISIAP